MVWYIVHGREITWQFRAVTGEEAARAWRSLHQGEVGKFALLQDVQGHVYPDRPCDLVVFWQGKMELRREDRTVTASSLRVQHLVQDRGGLRAVCWWL